MNANEIIKSSKISQIGISDDDKSLDGSKSFADIKATVVKAINIIDQALPKMKAAGQDMKKAAGDVDGLFRNIVRKGWGGVEVEFYVTREGKKTITVVTARHIDDIVEQVNQIVANY